MKRQIILTVAESKRVIAKGIAAMPSVKKAMKDGVVVVATGTTNAYILEELWERQIDKRRYRSGITVPTKPETRDDPIPERIPDVVFRNGTVDRELNRLTAPQIMGKGDIYLKGANALDYQRKIAGVLIGSPTGGTTGAVLGHIIGKKVTLIIPIGLEKLVYENINALHRLTMTPDYEGPSIWPITGRVITEIEALHTLTDVKATMLAAGGVAGAEGSVRLLLEGTEAEVAAATTLVESIKGEPRYLM